MTEAPVRAAPADLLLVDNDVTIAELVAWVLAREGHTVRTASSFAAARAHLAERRPDLMLSDVDLGAESALSELPRLAAAGRLPPTLVVSGYLDEDKRADLGALPEVVGFLDKPFDPRELAERVREALVSARLFALQGSPAPGAGHVVPALEDDDGWIEIGGAP
jgi:two-component system phosphate regulon response regulator PhoB